MNLYEFITPSDPITFKASDDKIAYCCALILGSGQAGCRRIEPNGEGESLPTLLMFHPEPEAEMTAYLGGELSEYVEANKMAVVDCFASFAYGSVADRQTYDEATEAITDPVKLQEFKAKHEDRNRTSMSKWVQYAWKYAEHFKQENAA